jgi:EAL domain-containing protein (putative c-di-GMP-specific phosphodiesterase class I)
MVLGDWVLESVCAQLAEWGRHRETAGIRTAVNISAVQLHHPQFVDTVRRMLQAAGARPLKLNMELTESVLIENLDTAADKMHGLKALGCEVSLDDFGTGYSSLSYLKRLPLDYIKIDRTFVRDVAVDKNSRAIARSIIAMSRTMGLSVIAEGVETIEQWHYLQRSGCQEFQGFLFGRPVPVEELNSILQSPATSPFESSVAGKAADSP